MQNIITGGFTGRMGNQAFQIASAVGLATKHNALCTFQKPTDNDVWKVYFTDLPYIDIEGLERQYYNEDVYEYREIPYSGGLLCLSGFFQSEKYFSHCRQQVIDTLKIPYDPIPGMVSIHVRRTDYVVGTPFEPIGMKYITKAIEYFNEKGYYNFFVFSDDLDWCKRKVNITSFPKCYFTYSQGRTEHEDLSLMNSCEHNIIANSTFSWWAGWLNQNENKIVVAPKKWFDGVNKDLLPETWVQL